MRLSQVAINGGQVDRFAMTGADGIFEVTAQARVEAKIIFFRNEYVGELIPVDPEPGGTIDMGDVALSLQRPQDRR